MIFGPHTATLVERGDTGSRDRQNNPIVGDLGPTHQLVGCFLQQRNTDETLDRRDSTDTTWLLVAPPPPDGVTITTEWHVRVDATEAHLEPDDGETFATFAIDGNPDYLDDFDGSLHHLELILIRVRL